MVITLLYTCTGTEIDGIDRHKDREIGSGEQKRKNSSYLPICLGCLEFVGLSVYFGCLGCQIDWFRFLTSHKKIF